MNNKRLMFFIEWLSTAILIVGVTLTAWNIYPLNTYFSLAGNVGWFIMGYAWRKWSLVIIQLVISLIYIIGVFSNT